MQETFLRVWNRVHSIDYLRSQAGRDRNAAVELDETDHAPLYREMEAGILMSDQVRRVKAAMDKLAPNHRASYTPRVPWKPHSAGRKRSRRAVRCS